VIVYALVDRGLRDPVDLYLRRADADRISRTRSPTSSKWADRLAVVEVDLGEVSVN